MYSIVSKITSVVLIILLLFIAPLYLSNACQQMVATREILNLTQNFIDEATDIGSISESDVAYLYQQVANTGVQVNVTIDVRKRVIDPLPGGTVTYTTYYPTSDYSDLHTGDILRVKVESIGNSGVQYVLKRLTGWGSTSIDFCLAGRVR